MATADTVATQIWNEAVSAVKPGCLIPQYLALNANAITIASMEYPLNELTGVLVVGFGKAAAEMAAAVEEILSPIVRLGKSLRGFVNAPSTRDGSGQQLQYITVHEARPAGLNRPTEAGVAGTARILELASSAAPTELVLVLISGGGSALSPAPVNGVSFTDKLVITEFLNETVGASIEELNCVRRSLSRIKGGGLARVINGKAVHGLILSDVIGDSLSVIASGPLESYRDEKEEALKILGIYDKERSICPASIYRYLESPKERQTIGKAVPTYSHIIGNNETALIAAIRSAEERGLIVERVAGDLELASTIGRKLADFVIDGRARPTSYIGGGEPKVNLPKNPGKGGRNQQLVLEAAHRLVQHDISSNYCILSGGTDGEDGPTDAAGGFLTADIIEAIREQELDLNGSLSTASAYELLSTVDGLFKTGLTGTNVCDVWLAVLL